MARAEHLPLALALTMLGRPLSSADREQCRAHIRSALRPPATRQVAEAEFLLAAAHLASHGASETDLRDLLEDESGCLERAGRRRERVQ